MARAKPKFVSIASNRPLHPRVKRGTYGDKGIVSTALNPGGIKTELLRHRSSFAQMLMVRYHIFFKLPKQKVCIRRKWWPTMYHVARSRSYMLEPAKKERHLTDRLISSLPTLPELIS